MPRRVPIAHLSIAEPGRMPRAELSRWLIARANDLASNVLLADERFTGRYIEQRPALYGPRDYTRAKLVVKSAGALSRETRQRIAKWLLSRARHIEPGSRGVFSGRWFTQEFAL
jgi:hypothetical protein